MNIVTSDIGLAAFAKSKGYSLVRYSGREFTFNAMTDCETEQRELEIQYANSCCRQHDANVMYLRSMTKQKTS